MPNEQRPPQSPEEMAAQPGGDMNERMARIEQLLGAHNTYLQDQIQQSDAAQQQAAAQQDEAAKQQELQARKSKVMQALQGYEDQPNLQAAINHVGGQWADEAKKYGMADEDIDAGVMAGLEKLATAALDNKMNPANVVYQYALQQGFKPAEAKQAAEQAAENAAQGGDAPAADGTPAAPPAKADGAGFVEAVGAGKRPAGGQPAGKADTFAAAQAAKKAGDMGEYARLMNGG